MSLILLLPFYLSTFPRMDICMNTISKYKSKICFYHRIYSSVLCCTILFLLFVPLFSVAQRTQVTYFDSIADGVFKRYPVFSKCDYYDAQHVSVTFDSARFDCITFFGESEFHLPANFRNALFSNGSNFLWTHFFDVANFKQAVFLSTVDFKNARFDSVVDFTGCQFRCSDVNFGNAKFKGEVKWNKAKLPDKLDFSFVTLEKLCNFQVAEYDSTRICRINLYGTDLKNIRFNYQNFRLYFPEYLTYAQIQAEYKRIYRHFIIRGQTKDALALKEDQSKADTNWAYERLPDSLDYSELELEKTCDFEYAIVDSGAFCYINLYRTDLTKIRFDYTRFRLYFPKELSISQQQNEYERVYRYFKENSQMSDVEEIGKEMYEHQYIAGKTGLSWIWGNIINFINKHWWGYGFDKQLIMRNSVIVFTFFWIFNLLFYARLNRRVYEIPFLWSHFRCPVEPIMGFSFKRIKTAWRMLFPSFFYTLLVFFGFKLSFDRLNYQNKWGVAYIVFQFILGLVCIGFLVNYVVGRNSWEI